jgi:hypothetical protein
MKQDRRLIGFGSVILGGLVYYLVVFFFLTRNPLMRDETWGFFRRHVLRDFIGTRREVEYQIGRNGEDVRDERGRDSDLEWELENRGSNGQRLQPQRSEPPTADRDYGDLRF